MTAPLVLVDVYAARAHVRLVYGVELNPMRIHQWVHRGRLTHHGRRRRRTQVDLAEVEHLVEQLHPAIPEPAGPTAPEPAPEVGPQPVLPSPRPPSPGSTGTSEPRCAQGVPGLRQHPHRLPRGSRAGRPIDHTAGGPASAHHHAAPR